MAAADVPDDWEHLTEDLDAAYENELKRSPYSVKVWWAYLQSKKDKTSNQVRFVLYERALRALPASYKLWYAYLVERREAVKDNCITDSSYEAVNNCFERCIVFLSRMPRIWLDYCDFLRSQKLITRTRRTFDRALRSLCITQHPRVWEKYMQFVKDMNVKEMAICTFRRYLMLEPDHVEAYIAFLKSAGMWDEAAARLADIVNDEEFSSMEGKSQHQLWMELCDLIAEHPEAIRSLKVEPVLRSGLRKFSDAVGRLWCSLADHFVRLGLMEKARDVYEEAVNSVTTVHDFALVFDAYSRFEEEVAMMAVEDENADDSDADLRLARLEYLMERRPILLSSVKLRQNPHNVHEWMLRVKIFKDDPVKTIETYSEAVQTIDAQKAVGKLHSLWLQFAKFYLEHDELENARVIFEKATQVNYRAVDDLASVWCDWVETEIAQGNFEKALEVARQCVVRPRDVGPDSVQARACRSVRLWCLASDVEENYGTLETTRACFHRAVELKVVTPQMVINFAALLEERKYFEDSFRAFESGIALFSWPHVLPLWLLYLSKFVQRYGGRKLERARDLFEQATAKVPPEHAAKLFFLYARLEEEFGLARRALQLYHRACQRVPPAEKYNMYLIYIAKTTELFGVLKTRKIFEEALEDLPDERAKDFCLEYARVERGLGETDRARAIYEHGSQYCDPKKEPQFWKVWRDFEVAYGNEDTFRDMLRKKRSVEAQYAQVHFNAAELSEVSAPAPADPMAAAEEELRKQDEDKRKREEDQALFRDDGEREKKRKAMEKEAEEAERQFLQMKRAKAAKAVEGLPDFIPADKFSDSKVGFVFKKGDEGLGYYKDKMLLSGDT
uniref:Suppressor of forked domain-containing protein n=1 Tax=Chromera velia CCMP2878 TaxID=1169474 RepID=A0A0G4GTZ3_9ALVE|mmetsp:Transcript_43320/g.85498  ORF Transcript_43320/g.85498 Transcript_43320/m.85498 type:complete len:845 (+) Transcript_43320:197-2731(+)|eukprot:Cvel_763.t1-p1 / transcript=Cvel_763.t1 / gene=Cvel_763 / organism=Chromera_velia_CCMP2878 / gene_product=Pre-mRNA-splicing factor SYF1, putative / transcript_product=Pre-mRNA-splicing factor SYF1, putative / location=Cvel_scaffold23:159716-166451(-) / protein_length=844 / sequence_SO=supercontig / SO=protein_coding / is_pseudo=false